MSVTLKPFIRAKSTGATSSAFSPTGGKIPTTTAITTSLTAAKFDLTDPVLGIHQGQHSSRYVQIVPFAENAADNDAFDLRLWAWNKTNDATPVYVPQLLIELNVTLGTIQATQVEANAYFANTIVIAKGDTLAPVLSYTAELNGSCLVHLRGAHIIEFDFDSTTGSGKPNCYWRCVDY